MCEALKDAGFTHYRGVRGDGNCYYRSVIYQYIELLAVSLNALALQHLVSWIENDKHYYMLRDTDVDYDDKKYKATIIESLNFLILMINQGKSESEMFSAVQRLFLFNPNFDLVMIYFLRKLTKNVLVKHQDLSLNELPLINAPIVEDIPGADTFDGYINNIVMKMQ